MSGTGERLELAYDVEGPRLNLGTAPEKLRRGEFWRLHGVDGRYTNSLRRFPGFERLEYTLSTEASSNRPTAINIRDSSNFYFFKSVSMQKGDTDFLLRGWIIVIDKAGGATNEVQAVFLHYDTENSAWYTYDIVVPGDVDVDLEDGSSTNKWTSRAGDADQKFLELFGGGDASYDEPSELFFDDGTTRFKMLKRSMAVFETESGRPHHMQWSYGKATGESGHTADTIYVHSSGGTIASSTVYARFPITLLNTHEFDAAGTGRDLIFSVRGQGNVTVFWDPETSQLRTGFTGPRSERPREHHEVAVVTASTPGYLSPSSGRYDFRVRYRWYNPRRHLWSKLSDEIEKSITAINSTIQVKFYRSAIGSLIEEGWTKLYVYRTILEGGTYYLEQIVNFASDPLAAPVDHDSIDDSMPGIDYDFGGTPTVPYYYSVYVGGRITQHDLLATDTSISPAEAAPIWSLGMNDTALTLQRSYDIFLDESGTPPKSGLVTAYQDMLVMKAEAAADTAYTSSTIRWSTLFAPTAENFPEADHAYRPSAIGHDILSIEDAGDYCFVVRDNGVVRLHRNSNILSVNELHRKIGGRGRYGATSAGQVLFVVTSMGVMAVDGTSGRQDLLGAIERLIIDPTDYWRQDLDSIHLLFDGELGSLMMLNTVKSEMYLLWMENGTVTSLVDCPFVLGAEGTHPITGGVDRSWWLGPNGYIFFPNFDRSADRQTMCGAVGAEYVNGYARRVVGSETTKFTLEDTKDRFAASPPASCVGFEVYFLSGNNRGRHRTITAISSDEVTVYPPLPTNIGTDDIVAIAPVVFDVKMAPITDAKKDEGADLYSRKRAHSMTCVFNQLEGDIHPSRNPHLKITYSVQPGRHGTPVERDVQMYENVPLSYGEVPVDGYVLFPGVRQLSSDVDFELHSVQVRATIDPS